MVFSLFRVAMDFVENIRVGKEGAKTGIRAEQDHPPAILDAWIVGRIRVAEDSSTQGDELSWSGLPFTMHRIGCVSHQYNFEIASPSMKEVI